MSSPTALNTDLTGQNGSRLAELLIAKRCAVHGTVRRTSSVERPWLRDHSANLATGFAVNFPR